MNYKELQYQHQVDVLETHPELFNMDKGNGYYKKKKYPFILENGTNNLFEPLGENRKNRERICQYFKDNNISWWGGLKPTGHMLSSQIACLNHLFYIRDDENAVLKLINNIRPGLQFTRVLPLPIDKEQKYIAFEAVSKCDYMNEGKPTRGANCTSIDALIVGESDNGQRWLIPIEWKFTESYPPIDKSQEDRPEEPKGSNGRGITRLNRYSDLINKSHYLRKYKDYAHTPYFFEPFYQLMRQTIWAEQMIEHKDSEWINANRFLHLHVIPSDNASLLNKRYKCTDKKMEESWKSLLLLDCYQTITPKSLLSPLKENDKYSSLIEYLQLRYW